RRRHTRSKRDWSSDVCSSDLGRVTNMASLPQTEVFEPAPYLRTVPRLFEHLRAKLGQEVELLHDCHEKLDPIQAARLAHDLEPRSEERRVGKECRSRRGPHHV